MNILDKIVAEKGRNYFSKSKISVEELKNSEYLKRNFSLKESVKSRNGIIAELRDNTFKRNYQR